MAIADTITYDSYFRMPGKGPYLISVQIRRPELPQVIDKHLTKAENLMKTARIFGILLGMILSTGVIKEVWAADPIPLDQLSHIHGIAVNPNDNTRLYVATHHGLYLASPDGTAVAVSASQDDLMGFSPHPTKPDTLYASGHPAGGGNLGFITSTDGGKTWKQLSPGTRGPADFHAMAVSKADPKVIYGAYGRLQVSRDGGHTWEPWERLAPLPDGLIALAASATDVNTLYAATRGGLLVSKDAGHSWQPAYPAQQPASLVATGNDGEIYAFIVGIGLLKSKDGHWTRLASDFGGRYLLHLAVDPQDSNELYAVTQDGQILASDNGGRHWRPFGPAD